MGTLRCTLAAVVVGFAFLAGLASPGWAGPAEHGSVPHSLQKLMDNPVLQVKKNKDNCVKYMVCDYFGPATACSKAPCCKEWHIEKVCD